MCVFSCVSLHLTKAFCIMSHCNLFLCCCCSFLTHRYSLLFCFIRYIIGHFFVVELSIYVCVFLCLSASWQGFLPCVTLQLVSFLLLFISHLSQLSFVLFYYIHYWQLFCGCIECLCVCFLTSLCISARLSASCHIATCVDVVDFSLVTTLFVLFH